ncbi:MAG: hypothetical protein SFX73_31340 [Kofleriaceae bacterium]|nr:hypothetical protein [Kofleriaceae bacterium]
MDTLTTDRRTETIALASVLGVAFVVRVAVAYAMPNMVWPDEIYQSLEQAHRAAFGYGIVPWEFHQGTRSWLLPGVLAAIMKGTSWLTSSVTAYLMACAAVMSAISLAPVWGTFRLARTDSGVRGAIVASSFVALWFEAIYFAPKALTEVVAGNVLVLGALLATHCARVDAPRSRVFGFAAALALSAMLRIQLAPAALVVFVLGLGRVPRTMWRPAVLVAASVVVVLGALDAITWSYPFQSYVENVRANLVEGQSARFGTASWSAYFEVYGRIWGVWLVPILGLAALGARRAPLLAIAAALVLVAHVPIGHKEYRFAYPAMLAVIALAGLGGAAMVTWIEQQRSARVATLAAVGLVALWLAGSLQRANGFHGAKTQLATVYSDEQDHWARRRGGLAIMRRIGELPEACGVGLAIPWADTGGYTYLHRDLPLIELPTRDAMRDYMPYYNVVVTKLDPRDQIGPFVRVACEGEACAFVRPGDCQPQQGLDVNSVIERRGQETR